MAYCILYIDSTKDAVFVSNALFNGIGINVEHMTAMIVVSSLQQASSEEAVKGWAQLGAV